MNKVVSGIQPTGQLHLGNYFGAIQNWVKLQEEYDCKYFIADYHAISTYAPSELRYNVISMHVELVACGIKPENLFLQSLIPEHTELCWILNSVTSFGELQRMTQFKDKSQKLVDDKEFIPTSLFNYPILQAADILLHNADFVPVGIDQAQHLQLAKLLANKFNKSYESAGFQFTEPKALLTEFPKIMSPADPTRKMSKSLGPKHCIYLTDSNDEISKKIKRAVTDSSGDGTSPGVLNLLTLLKASNESLYNDKYADLESYGEIRYSDLKSEVADSLIDMINPIRESMSGESIVDKSPEVMNALLRHSRFIRDGIKSQMCLIRMTSGLLFPNSNS